jgi:transcriptional regulator with XRE-family HTH domain
MAGMEADFRAVGARIRAFRHQCSPRMSLTALAGAIECCGAPRPSTATLSRIETGRQKPSLAILPALAAITRIPPDELRPDLSRLLRSEAT